MHNPFDLPTAESRSTFPEPTEEELAEVQVKVAVWLKLLNPYQRSIAAMYHKGVLFLRDSQEGEYYSTSLGTGYFPAWEKISRSLKDLGYVVKLSREEPDFLLWKVSLPEGG